MKNKRSIIAAIMVFTFILCNCVYVYSVKDTTEKVTITTEDYEVGSVYYGGYEIFAKKIFVGKKLGYCLQIEKDYPNGESFSLEGPSTEGVKNILLAGYPNRTPEELGLTSADDAYFATQVALWSYLEKYDTNDISGGDPEVLAAIRQVFDDGIEGEFATNNIYFKQYYTNDKVQHVVLAASVPEKNEKPVEPEFKQEDKQEDEEKVKDKHEEKVEDKHEEKSEESSEKEEEKHSSPKKVKVPAQRG